MGTINKKKASAVDKEAHLNWMGGQSFDIKNPILRLRVAAASSFFGEPQYYHRDKDDKRELRINPEARLSDAEVDHLREELDAIDPREWRKLTPTALMEKAIDEALESDPKATLELAVHLRNEEDIRTTPQVIMVRAAHHDKVRGTQLIGQYAPEIMKRVDEPCVQLAYQLEKYGKDKPIPNSLKRAWKTFLEKSKEYHLAKYRSEGREVKLVDVVNLVHAKSDAVDKLMRGKLKNTDQTWEAIISKEGSTKEAWTKALDVMGHMGMLRNVRNLLTKGVDSKLFLTALIAGAEKGKQLPFRYVSAYNAIKEHGSGAVQDAIEECLKLSLGNLPTFPGRLISLCDNSGSAQGTTTSSMGTMRVSSIANLTGVLAGMRADDGYLGIFGDDLNVMPVRKGASVFDQLEKAEQAARGIGGNTENGIWMFWKKAIIKKEHWDNVFVFSDMQAGHGGLYGTNPSEYKEFAWTDKHHIDVAKLINKYRATVNPKVNVHLVQVAGYTDVIIPEFYKRTYILGGWSDKVLRFAAEMAQMMDAPQQ